MLNGCWLSEADWGLQGTGPRIFCPSHGSVSVSPSAPCWSCVSTGLSSGVEPSSSCPGPLLPRPLVFGPLFLCHLPSGPCSLVTCCLPLVSPEPCSIVTLALIDLYWFGSYTNTSLFPSLVIVLTYLYTQMFSSGCPSG